MLFAAPAHRTPDEAPHRNGDAAVG
jgi:hypothetical protein